MFIIRVTESVTTTDCRAAILLLQMCRQTDRQAGRDYLQTNILLCHYITCLLFLLLNVAWELKDSAAVKIFLSSVYVSEFIYFFLLLSCVEDLLMLLRLASVSSSSVTF